MRHCAEGGDERFGVIEFAVGVDVTAEFRRAVSEVAEEEWQTLHREVGERRVDTGQQWAEVNFVPNWIGHSKNSPNCRFIAVREPLRNPSLPGMGDLSVPIMEMGDGGWYKVFGVAANRGLPGDELVWWYRQRCGKGEEVHAALKEDSGRGPAAVGPVWGQRRLVGHNGAGLQPELGDEAAGVGRRVGEQTDEGGPLRGHLPAGTGGPALQDSYHQSEPGPPLIRAAGGGAAKNPRPRPRASGRLTGPHRSPGPPKSDPAGRRRCFAACVRPNARPKRLLPSETILRPLSPPPEPLPNASHHPNLAPRRLGASLDGGFGLARRIFDAQT